MNIGKALDWNGIFGIVIPLYFVIFLGYGSVRWWKILTPEQCNGINKYVAEFAFPFLVLEMLMATNVYTINFLVVAADSVQKIFILGFSFEWLVTLFIISGFTNNVAIGIPLIESIYGEDQTTLLIQILVFQSIIWFNVAIAMYEYISARNHVLKDNELKKTCIIDASTKVDNGIAENSSNVSVRDPNNHGQLYTDDDNIVAHECIHVDDVQIDPSQPSIQQQVTPTRYVSEYYYRLITVTPAEFY
ncbi:hypothetical protein Lal_00023021 [Lupinus albus]|nr:hypothetical protein Lal_00023021 [Lupinus albus]